MLIKNIKTKELASMIGRELILVKNVGDKLILGFDESNFSVIQSKGILDDDLCVTDISSSYNVKYLIYGFRVGDMVVPNEFTKLLIDCGQFDREDTIKYITQKLKTEETKQRKYRKLQYLKLREEFENEISESK